MTTERWTLLAVGALNVGAGALLASWNDGWPVDMRIPLVVVQAVAVFVLAQVKSWDDAAPAEVPHG